MAASDIYRSYQVLIEESIDRRLEEGATLKESKFNRQIVQALHTTNRLYQDALCYYILALAGLAKDLLLNPLWEHVTRSLEMQPHTQTVIARLAGRYAKFKDVKSPEDFLRSIYSSGVSEDQLQQTYQLLEQQGVEAGEDGEGRKCADLSNFASSWASILCDEKRRTVIPGSGAYDKLHRQLRSESDLEQVERLLLEELRTATEERTRVELIEFETALAIAQKAPSDERQREIAAQRAKAVFNRKKIKRDQLTRKAFVAGFKGKFCNGLPAEMVARSIDEIEAAKADDPRFGRLREGTNYNRFEKSLYRLLWLRNDPTWRQVVLQDMADYLKKDEPEPESVEQMPYQSIAKILFPFFGNCLGIPTAHRSPWWEFDKAAFAEAAGDVFKYKLATEKREQTLSNIEHRLRLFENEGEYTAERMRDGSTRQTYKIRGMRGDVRLEKMRELLVELGKGLGGYSLRPATIGGWADVRKAFLKKERQQPDDLANTLVELVEKAQAESAGGFGSAPFFLKLCEEVYFELWQSDWPEKQNFHAEDFVRHYVRYSELKREEQELRGHIRFTWPGGINRFGETSYRHFDFAAPLRPQIKTKLFVQNSDSNEASPTYALTDELTLTLTGRRMKRDRLVNAKGDSIDAMWSPPLVSPEDPPRITAKKKKEAKAAEVSFSLMVRDGSERSADGEILHPPVYLNVAVQVTGAELKKIQGDAVKWEGSMRRNRDRTGRFLRWPIDLKTETKIASSESKPSDGKKQNAAQLWCGDGRKPLATFNAVKSDNFDILAVDLGVRVGAAFARSKIKLGGDEGRRISPDDWSTDVRAVRYRVGELRLPGEDANVWKKGKGFEREEFGRRGRFPTAQEIEEFLEFAKRIYPPGGFALPDAQTLTYPELADHLVFRLKRRLSRIRTLFNLRWRLIGKMERNPDSEELLFNIPRTRQQQQAHHRNIAEMLGRQFVAKTKDPEFEEETWMRTLREKLAPEDAWAGAKPHLTRRKKELAESNRRTELDQIIASWNWDALGAEVMMQLSTTFEGLPEAVEKLCLRCLPLRDKLWCWRNSNLTLEKAAPDRQPQLRIRGMRGLSIVRIEQVQELRRALQSLAKLEKRLALGSKPGEPGVEPVPTRRSEVVDDACPNLLDKINERREQRVNQIAHMILAEGLGKTLVDPSTVQIDGKEKPALKSERDLHGVYEPIKLKDGSIAPKCALVVVENLTRYRMSQDRARFENRRLMEWSNRNVIKKLQDIAKPFRIEILLVDAAYSSRFDSRTGSPGIRVKKITAGFEKEPPFSKWIAEKRKAKGHETEFTERAKTLRNIKDVFDNGFKGELIVPIEGGPLFLPLYPIGNGEGLENADINAATNIGLRAIAHPDCLDIFMLLKTDALAEDKLRIRNSRGAFAALPADDAAREVSLPVKANLDGDQAVDAEEEDEIESGARPNLFIDVHADDLIPRAETFRVELPSTRMKWHAAKSAVFWPRVRYLANARIEALNAKRKGD